MAFNMYWGACASAGVRFYQAVTVQDPDDGQKEYSFDLADTAHGACFNIGMGPDGSPLISWSDLHALYELPDGTKWAEHGFFHDVEDMVCSPSSWPCKPLTPMLFQQAVGINSPCMFMSACRHINNHTIPVGCDDHSINIPHHSNDCTTGRAGSGQRARLCQPGSEGCREAGAFQKSWPVSQPAAEHRVRVLGIQGKSAFPGRAGCQRFGAHRRLLLAY